MLRIIILRETKDFTKKITKDYSFVDIDIPEVEKQLNSSGVSQSDDCYTYACVENVQVLKPEHFIHRPGHWLDDAEN